MRKGGSWAAWWALAARAAEDPPLGEGAAMKLFAELGDRLDGGAPWRTADQWTQLGVDAASADSLASMPAGAIMRTAYLQDERLARGVRPIITEAVRLAGETIVKLMHEPGVAVLRPEVPADQQYVALRGGEGTEPEVGLASAGTPVVDHVKALRAILAPGAAFPFARCRRCRKIFARERSHQAFCDRRCRLRWNDAQRGKPKGDSAGEEGMRHGD